MMVSKKSGYLGRLKDIDRTLGEMRQDGTIGRIYADIRAFRIYDGPSEVHRWSIANNILRRAKPAQ